MRRFPIAFIAMLLAITACGSATQPTSTLAGGRAGRTGGGGIGFSGGAGQAGLIQGALVRFQACDDFLSHVKAEALQRVGPHGLDGYYGWDVAMRADSMEMAPQSGGAEVGGYSTTNNQEAGVDEGDIVKTDGRRLVTVVNSRLVVVDVSGDVGRITGSLLLAPDRPVSDIFLAGDRVVLIGSSWNTVDPYIDEVGFAEPNGMIAPDYYPGTPVVVITEIDISSGPRVVKTLEVDGTYLSSRAIDGLARIVVTSGPTGLVWAYPQGGGLKAEQDAIAANKQIINESTIDNWVPYYLLRDARGDVVREGSAVPCDQARHPAEFAGFNMVSILTLDLATGIDIADSTGVLAGGQSLYSSKDSMYISTNEWVDFGAIQEGRIDAGDVTGARTQIHQFDISGATTIYTATGSVPGFLQSQFAMSELNGDLRVASTTAPDWWGRNDITQESMVSVLRPDQGELKLIGQVAGLGRDERIYSVRFMGDVGYVVTFRQVDPLFTIDLSDPESPVVRGELKIPGYSSYLHPISDSRLLGIGQDATGEGRIVGTQVSLFDVSNLDSPELVAKYSLGIGTNSTVEWDHRAFLYWDGYVVIPVTDSGGGWAKESMFQGAVVLQITDGEILESGHISHPYGTGPNANWNAAILRSVVVGDSLYTVSNLGIMQSDIAGLDQIAWLDFATR